MKRLAHVMTDFISFFRAWLTDPFGIGAIVKKAIDESFREIAAELKQVAEGT